MCDLRAEREVTETLNVALARLSDLSSRRQRALAHSNVRITVDTEKLYWHNGGAKELKIALVVPSTVG